MRRVWHILARYPVRTLLAGFLLLVLMLASFVRIAAMTGLGHGFAERQVAALSPSGQSILIEGVSGDLLGRFEIGRLQVRDVDGTWLAAEAVTVRWSPLALLAGHLKLDEVSAERLTASRRPETLTREQDGSEDGAGLGRYTLGSLVIGRLELGAPLVPEPQVLGLTATLATDIATGELQADLAPITGEGDRLSAAIAWGGRVPVTGTLTGSGPDGGLLSELLGLGGRGPVIIGIDGRGDRDNWTLSATGRAGETLLMALDARRAGDEVSAAARLDLTQSALTAGLADRIGPGVELAAEDAGSGRLDVRLSSEVLTLAISPAIDLETGSLGSDTMPVSLLVRSLGQITGTGLEGEARLDGVLTRINSQTWQVDGDLDAIGLAFDPVSASRIFGPLELTVRTDGSGVVLVSNLASEGFRLSGKTDQRLGDAPGLVAKATFFPEAGEADVGSLVMRAAQGEVRLSGQAAFDLSKIDLDGSASLAPSGGLPGLAVRRWRAVRGSAEEPIAITLAGRADLADLPESLGGWPGETADIRLDALAMPGGELTLRRLNINSPQALLSLSGRMGNGSPAARLDFEATSGDFGAAAFDRLTFGFDLAGAGDGIKLAGQARASGVLAGGEPVVAPALDFDGTYSGGVITGRLSVGATIRDEPFRLHAEPEISSTDWRLASLSASWDLLSGSGILAGSGADLRAINGDLRVEGRLGRSASAPAFSGSVALSDALASFDVTASNVTASGIELAEIRLTGSGARNALTGNLMLSGTVPLGGDDDTFRLTAPIEANLVDPALTLSPEGALGGAAFTTLDPIGIALRGDGLAAEGRFGLFGGSAAFDLVQVGDALNAGLRIEGVRAGRLGRVFGRRGLRGELAADLRLSGAGDALSGEGAISISNLRAAGRESLPTDLRMDLSLGGGVLAITAATLADSEALSLQARGMVPVSAAASPFGLTILPDAPLAFSLAGTGRLESLWALFGSPEARLEGSFAVNATGEGPLATLFPEGTLSVSDAVFEDAASGLHLVGISLSTRLDDQAVSVSDFSARGVNGGTISGNGRAGLDGFGEVSLALDGLNALQRDDISASVSGTVALSRPDEQTSLTGDLVIDRARINLDRLPASGVTTIDVRFPSENGEPEVVSEPAVPVRLDIGLKANRRIFVEGTGIASEWGIDTRILGTLSEPRLAGTARIVRGDLDFAGRNFQFVDSRVVFNGLPEDARLAIRAERVSADLTAGFEVTGTVSDPAFALSSTPSLPEDEILSRVLFGRSAAQLSALEAAQLAAAVARLSGGGSGGFDLIGPLQDALGIDRLDFGVSQDGDATVGVGEYIGEDVYVELRTNARGDTGLAVEWTPLSNLALSTELGQAAEPRFGIRWRRDFNIGDGPATAAGTQDDPVRPDDASLDGDPAQGG